jgi:glycosyltransferase involved in cell wall biosynthesis
LIDGDELQERPARTPSRVVVWSPGIPHPTDGASSVVFWHYISALRSAGLDVLNIVLLNPTDSTTDELEAYRSAMQEGDRFRVYACVVPSFTRRWGVAIRLNADVVEQARVAARNFEPEAEVCLDLLSTWVAGSRWVPRVVWLGDLNFQTSWYHALYAAKEDVRNAVRVPVAAWLSLVWQVIYRKVLKSADYIIVASKSSERVLARLGLKAAYEPYPWPSDGPAEVTHLPPQPTFLFLGTLQALGSRSAFHVLFRRLYPLLVRQWGPGGFRILVAGRGDIPPWARDAMATRPEFESLGFVEDLTQLLGTVHAVLAPISVPVGNRTRILTAMAAGTLVIAHRNAALGNPLLIDGVTCYLATRPSEMATKMRLAVEDSDERFDITRRAQDAYAVHQTERASRRLLEVLSAISRPPFRAGASS